MIKFKTIFIFLFVICSNGFCFGQRTIQNILVNYESNNLENFSKSYLNGNYCLANKQLKKLKKDQIFCFNQFYENSIIYQRDIKKLKKEFIRNSELFQPSVKFYIEQQPMEIVLNEKTIVSLSKNRIVGIIGNDTLNILFDTGGAGISINKKFVDKYKMKTDTSIKSGIYAPAFNYKSSESPVIIPRLTIGTMVMNNIPAKFNSENKELKENTEIDKFDIIMGIDVFVGYIKSIKFDWINNNLTFSNKEIEQKLDNKFIFFDSKPIILMNIKNQVFTALLDTGSPVDLIDKTVYEKNHTFKEEKKYGSFTYKEYTVPVSIKNKILNLKAADYKPNFNLKLSNEIIDFIIGNNHKNIIFDLVNNRYNIE